MLTAATLSSAGAAAGYFPKDNYYTSAADTPSAWWGKGAEALGLSGPVDAKEFEAVLSGRLPDGTELGTTRNGEWQHKPGWDLTWSAPKSVSVMALVQGDARLVEAHDKAVRAAMAHVEATLIHTRVRNGPDVDLVQTDNLVAALFRHAESRMLEPQLHTHAIVANATQTEDGQWRSIESKPMLQAIKDSGAVYRSFLAAEVTRLGYEIVVGKDLTFEIAGVPQALLKDFSTRSANIEAWLAERDLTRASASTEEKTSATLMTRPGKQRTDQRDLTQKWRNDAASVLPELEKLETLGAIEQAARAAEQTPQQAQTAQNAAALRAVDLAIAHLSEREQAFSHQRLEREAARFGMGQANQSDIAQAIGVRVKQAALLPRQVREISHETKADALQRGYTTPAAIRAERDLFGLLDRARAAGRPLTSERVAGAAVAAAEQHAQGRGQAWNDGQRTAALGILRSPDRIVLLQGWAGTAKTSTVIATVAAAAQAAGYNVRAAAPFASAAQTLGRSLGIDGQTVDGFLNKLEREDARPKSLIERIKSVLSPSKDLWIVDEMSLLGVNKTVELLAAAERHDAKVLLTGDFMQLGAVEAGKPFAQALEQRLDTFRLTDILRQKTEEGRAAVEAIIARDPYTAIDRLRSDGAVIAQISSREPAEAQQKRVEDIARRYASLTPAERANTIVIDPSRDGGEKIKAEVRSLLQATGELAGPAARGERLLRANLSNTEKSLAVSYSPSREVEKGQDAYTGPIIVRTGQAIEGLDGKMAAGEYGRVTAVDTARNHILVARQDGTSVTIDTSQLNPRRFDVFHVYDGQLQANDRIRWNRNDKKLGLSNGDAGVVTAVQGNTATIAFEKGGTHQFDVSKRENQHYDYGYTVTAYGAQGMTKNWILHAESWRINLANWRSMYVGFSRGETSGTIVTDSVQQLGAAIIGRAGEKTSALGGHGPSPDPSNPSPTGPGGPSAPLIDAVRQAASEVYAAEQTSHTPSTAALSSDEHRHRAHAQNIVAQRSTSISRAQDRTLSLE
jgi:conjugative relaxase-like TrwC/TraI family protein